MSKSVYGVGINDYEGKISYYENGKRKTIKSYQTWKNMIVRCYYSKALEKHPTYTGCMVSEKWLSYSNFKKWFDLNFPFELSSEIDFQLDKDLFIDGNKIYSEENCLFIPGNVNKFLSNKTNTNTSGFIGVCFMKSSGKFQANINHFGTGKFKYLGIYNTANEASESYIKARKYMVILAKQYMRDLNIYSEEIIKLIK